MVVTGNGTTVADNEGRYVGDPKNRQPQETARAFQVDDQMERPCVPQMQKKPVCHYSNVGDRYQEISGAATEWPSSLDLV